LTIAIPVFEKRKSQFEFHAEITCPRVGKCPEFKGVSCFSAVACPWQATCDQFSLYSWWTKQLHRRSAVDCAKWQVFCGSLSPLLICGLVTHIFVSRRSTLAASGSAKLLEDPRNVKDKTFIRTSLQRLIEFLVENNYDRQISQKQLEAPATKDFLHILNFLYNKIDPKFQLGPNILEDVPLLFKRLRSIPSLAALLFSFLKIYPNCVSGIPLISAKAIFRLSEVPMPGPRCWPV
jgi:hypothetical protein